DNASFVHIEGINSTQRHAVETFNHSTTHVLHRKSGVGHGIGRLTAQVGPHITSSIEGRTTQAHVRDKAHSLEHEVRDVRTSLGITNQLGTVDVSDTNNITPVTNRKASVPTEVGTIGFHTALSTINVLNGH